MNIKSVINFFDVKTNIIIILGTCLLLFIFFKKIKSVDTHKAEIEMIHKENARLKNKYDSLSVVNDTLNVRINQYQVIIKTKEGEIKSGQQQIIKLKNEKDKIRGYVLSLSANGVSRKFTEYLQESDKNRSK